MILVPAKSSKEFVDRLSRSIRLAKWFNPVQIGSELNHSIGKLLIMSKVKTFSVRLEADAYTRLCKLADTHKPKLTKNYLMQLAVERLLQLASQGQLELVFPSETSK